MIRLFTLLIDESVSEFIYFKYCLNLVDNSRENKQQQKKKQTKTMKHSN